MYAYTHMHTQIHTCTFTITDKHKQSDIYYLSESIDQKSAWSVPFVQGVFNVSAECQQSLLLASSAWSLDGGGGPQDPADMSVLEDYRLQWGADIMESTAFYNREASMREKGERRENIRQEST